MQENRELKDEIQRWVDGEITSVSIAMMIHDLKTENKHYRQKFEEIITSPNMSPYGYRQIAREALNDGELAKIAIKIKDGVAQMDKDHPDYNFWMEDDD